MTVFVDESLRQRTSGLCVIAALTVTGDQADLRRRLRSLLLRQQPRFHWRAESESQRLKFIDVLTEVAGSITAYCCSSVPTKKQPRARVQCLKQLLWDLRQLPDVSHLVIESRQSHNDHHDRQVILRAQRAGAAPTTLRYDFRRPTSEPLLWLADAAAGAVTAHMGDGVGHYVEKLGERVKLTAVDL